MDDENESVVVADEVATPVDVSVYEAKIAELESAVADRDNVIIAKDAEITAAKAANYDLLMSVPSDTDDTNVIVDDSDESVDYSDLFGKDE